MQINSSHAVVTDPDHNTHTLHCLHASVHHTQGGGGLGRETEMDEQCRKVITNFSFTNYLYLYSPPAVAATPSRVTAGENHHYFRF